MRTILTVPCRRLVLDHPQSTTGNRTARLNTTHHRLTTTPSVTIGRIDCLFEMPNRLPPKALPSNRTAKAAPKTIVTVLNPHIAGQRRS